MKKTVKRLSVHSSPARLCSSGIGCALAAAAGGLSFVALEADAAVAYNGALGVMVDTAVNHTITAGATSWALPLMATTEGPKAIAKFPLNSGWRRINNISVVTANAGGLKSFSKGALIATTSHQHFAKTAIAIDGTFSPSAFIGVRFSGTVKESTGTHDGWIEYQKTSQISGKVLAYAYKTTAGATIRAAGPQVEGLLRSGGALSWKAVSEEGVARYEVEKQGSDGSWAPVATVLPGKADYKVDGLGAGACRLVSVDVNGSREDAGAF